jgi:hypothetical protein
VIVFRKDSARSAEVGRVVHLQEKNVAGEDVMRKLLLILVAAASLTVATLAAPTKAEAYCRGCWIGAGVAGAVIAGAAIANAAPYYGYGYGYRPAYYGYPYYYGPRYYYGGYYGPRYYGPRYYGYYGGPRYYPRRYYW